MLDGNVLLRQKCDEVPEGTLSCPDRNMEVFNQLRHYEGLRLLPSVCEQIIIQQTLISNDLDYLDTRFLTTEEIRRYIDNNNTILRQMFISTFAHKLGFEERALLSYV